MTVMYELMRTSYNIQTNRNAPEKAKTGIDEVQEACESNSGTDIHQTP